MSVPRSDHPAEVLSVLARQLAGSSGELGARTVEVLRERSPELVRRSEEYGGDPVATSAGFLEILLGSLRTDVELPWKESERTSRDYGRERASQGMPLESLIEEMAVYRRATIELISVPLHVSSRRDEIVAYAQGHLDDVVVRLTGAIAGGYLDHIAAENHARHTEIVRLSRRATGVPKRVAQQVRGLARVGAAKLALVTRHVELDHACHVIRHAAHQASRRMLVRAQLAVSFGVAAWQSGQEWRAAHRYADADLDQKQAAIQRVPGRSGVTI